MLIVIGLIALVAGAELVVRGSARVARRLGVTPLVIGLTVVSVGTSAPELAIGIDAGLIGAGDLAVGNIAGTNIVNLLLILGLSAVLRPLPLHAQTISLHLPAMCLAAATLLVMAADGTLSPPEGALLVAGAVGYTVLVVRASRSESPEVRAEYEAENPPFPRRHAALLLTVEIAALLAGLAVIVVGADWLVHGSVALARRLGVSDAVIGLTVVAIGTSAPELATTIVATVRRHRDVAVGNLIGSSVYNIAFILGMAAAVVPGGLPVTAELLRIDLPAMTAATFACVPVFLRKRQVTRGEGGLFVFAYLAYLGYLLLVRI